jgi:P27 family predicted phage terminase small subunit
LKTTDKPSQPKPPTCPDHLDADAKREWKRLVKLLLRMRVLTDADGLALANLCQAWSTLVKAQIKLNETGLLLKTPSGYVQQSPLLGIVNSCIDTVLKLSREFGLTPSSRGRLQVEPEPQPESKIGRLLRMAQERRGRGQDGKIDSGPE